MSINNNNNNNHNIISKIAVVQYTPFQQPNPTFFSPPLERYRCRYRYRW